MRILEVIADGSPGGGTTHVLQVVRGLSDNHQFAILSQPDSYLHHESREKGIDFYGVDLFSYLSWIYGCRRIRAAVHEYKPDLVHVHGSRAGIYSSFSKIDVPVIFTLHGYHFLHQTPPLRKIRFALEHRTCAAASRVIFVSKHDRDVALENRVLRDGDNFSVIYNSVPMIEGVEEVSPSEKLVGFVGRLIYQKDPLLFLDVMERLPEHSGVIVGGGDLEDRVQEEIEARSILNLQYLGPKDHAEVIEILPTFSVLLMTSRWEGLPILPLEAMELGVPVVATNVGGIGEIIKDGDNGVLNEGRSPGKLADAVRMVLNDEAFRLKLIRNGKRRIQESFSEERMLKEIDELYKSIRAE